MEKQNKAYRFRIYPDEAQKAFILRTFGCCRFVWNHLLDERLSVLETTGRYMNSTPAHLKAEYAFLKEVDAQALCNVQMQLNKAFADYKRNPAYFKKPCFKAKHHSRNSYTTNLIKGNVRINQKEKTIRLPKVGEVRIVLHRNLKKEERIKSVTVSMESGGRYYVSVLVEYSAKNTAPVPVDAANVLGLDYSSPFFYVDEHGDKASNHRKFFRENEIKLAKAQRALTRMKKGSNNWNRQKTKVGAINAKIADSRRDWIEKETAALSVRYDAIIVEGINMKDISQGLHLGKSTLDNGWGLFRQRLEEKLHAKGKQLVVLDRWEPSTKKCCRCGALIPGLTLNDRIVTCPSCGSVMDRDVQAAMNIKQSGMKLLWDAEVEPVDTGDQISLSRKERCPDTYSVVR
ncbi:MAG: transposase [Spirochaetales bacterium]|nr:transposase [Candidatus Physcosoma equi]